jgi:hypothetical protein
MLKGLDDYMILDEQAFKIKTNHGTLLVLNFEYLLVLNHDDMTWDYPKREDLGKREDIIKNIVSRKVRRVVGTCSKKPQILFWIYDRF